MKKMWITACDVVCGGWEPICFITGEDKIRKVALYKTELEATQDIADVLLQQIDELKNGSRSLEDFGTDEVPIEVEVNDDLSFEFEGKAYQGTPDKDDEAPDFDGETWTG